MQSLHCKRNDVHEKACAPSIWGLADYSCSVESIKNMNWRKAAIVESKIANHDVEVDKMHEQFTNFVLLLWTESRPEWLEDNSYFVQLWWEALNAGFGLYF